MGLKLHPLRTHIKGVFNTNRVIFAVQAVYRCVYLYSHTGWDKPSICNSPLPQRCGFWRVHRDIYSCLDLSVLFYHGQYKSLTQTAQTDPDKRLRRGRGSLARPSLLRKLSEMDSDSSRSENADLLPLYEGFRLFVRTYWR